MTNYSQTSLPVVTGGKMVRYVLGTFMFAVLLISGMQSF